ncbi:winged helix-turn-helix domain-containing protein [Aliikangiella coralliicola]|uniref:OmpR/PhoB-type domain-containing protein n=1 Tax=Aliikangiella coralliicola TaxID=2592383 RepID=A0A545U0D8_9GAMM|nr:winged helix-turn-helix domain-containing protein [Aliikangiella coralliicola]TQV82932.1 hypothetical protein FLL46_24490 [Aliikangiella coralliicola]
MDTEIIDNSEILYTKKQAVYKSGTRNSNRLNYPDFEIGGYLFCPRDRKVNHDGEEIILAGKVMHTLCLLVSCQGEVISHDYLIKKIWNDDYIIGKKGVSNAIWQLRKILGKNKALNNCIQTVPRKGYLLNDNIEIGTAEKSINQRHRVPNNTPTSAHSKVKNFKLYNRGKIKKRLANINLSKLCKQLFTHLLMCWTTAIMIYIMLKFFP